MMESLQYGILLYFIGINLTYLIIFVVSCAVIIHYRWVWRFRGPQEILKARVTPPISILVPVFNEQTNVATSLRAILNLNYPQYEIIVINDGSTDNTLSVLTEAFSLRKTAHVYHRLLPTEAVRGIYRSRTHPHVWVLDKENGKKADALNAGINFSQYPLFCALDGDSLLDKDALIRVVRPYMDRFQEVVAVGGIVRVANGCRIQDSTVKEVNMPRTWLPRFQVVEYIRAFLSGRLAWSYWNNLLIISGAFGVFKKQPVIEVGGFARDTVGEDMELVLRLHKHLRKQKRKYHIYFIPDPVCWTEVPEDMKSLGNQRNRWQRGLAQCLDLHRDMLFNPKYGTLGLLAMPFFLFVELLSPVVELIGYGLFASALLSRTVNWDYMMAFLVLSVGMGMLLSLLSVLLEEFTISRYPRVTNLLLLFLTAAVENFGYRQIMSWYRLKGLWDFLLKNNTWGTMTRKGLEAKA